MDDTLHTLFAELCVRIEDLQKKNPEVNTDDIMRSCIMIQSYLDGYKTEEFALEELKPEVASLPDISYEEICKLTRPPRKTPKGHAGPTFKMCRYAEEEDNKRARLVDTVIQQGKEMDKNNDKPYF